MGGILGYFWRQWTRKPKPLASSKSLEGKTALITGASIGGLGFEAAKELASHKLSRLIIAVRDLDKGDGAKNAILTVTPNINLEVWQLDYDDYDSILAFSQQAEQLERLDFVLLNAGLKKLEYSKSRMGHENNVQVNHLGTALLSLLLLPTLEKTTNITNEPSRMTIVSSEVHFWVSFKEYTAPNIISRMDEKSSFGSGMDRYNKTKLLNVLWALQLASKITNDKVVVNTVNPGLCYSGLHRHEKPVGITTVFLWLTGWTTQQGGHCLVDALVEHETSHGKYLSEQRVTSPSNFVLSMEGVATQKKLWNETLDLFKAEVPKAKLPVFLD
ncbi:short-chain dehydrogenase/reductase SDR [Delitschia confertaspora ATCC 74209]|uniref:Short-chain dehydrogenase/reductase SDR n=1 Tax=Delitschia confertaspora ATCC 74209 TaxID=1513339 RepID=A0A9P4MQP0_9PLEO|nr:short-chain dehydrogenase/reductase SDR [Delitschia confertaspora ATCC 74209]